jgi:hypothetical protein
MTATLDLPTIPRLAYLADVVERGVHDGALFVRWSHGPEEDLVGRRPETQTSRDALTGVMLPGLSANALAVEPWWGERSLRLWVARRLYDYQHLRDLRGPGVRPWVLVGQQTGRGPDNEPLVICRRPVAWIADAVLAEAQEAVARQASTEWGPLDRR